MRIGVFGGSFDPPHAAHAALARAAQTQLGIDRILWVPTAFPPHKREPETPLPHRLGMTRALVAGDSGSEASDVEATLPSPSYTLRTLNALKKLYGPGHGWHLILGSDNWAALPRWHRPDDVLTAAIPAVFPRPGFPLKAPLAGATVLDFPEMPHRSSVIRERLHRGGAPRAAALAELPGPVAAYIGEHALYSSFRSEKAGA